MKTALRKQALALLREAMPSGTRFELAPNAGRESIVVLSSEELPQLKLELRDRSSGADVEPGLTPVLVFRSKRSEERENIRGQEQCFIDLSGAVHIRARGLYLDRSDLPEAPPATSRRRVDPYADASSRVVRRLLAAPRSQRWSTRGLADASEVDPSTVSRVVGELRRRGLVKDECPGERRRSRIWVPDPERVLEDWTRSYRWTDNFQLRLAAPVGSPGKFVDRMPAIFQGYRWALTMHAGASMLAPHATFDLVHAYVDAGASLEEIALELGWEPSDSGKLCLLSPVQENSVWFDQRLVNRVPVVGTVQLMIDLWDYPVRGREQARHLMDTVLRPIWQSSDEPS